MKFNAVYLCCMADPWASVAMELVAKGVEPVYFVYWKSDELEIKKRVGSACFLQSIEDAWKGRGFPANLQSKSIDEPTIRHIAWYQLNALKMMDRLEPLGSEFSTEARVRFFHQLLGYWLACVEKFSINLVISPSIPHRVFDYALYIVCKIKGIRFLTFQMVPFGSRSFIIEDIEHCGSITFDCQKEGPCRLSDDIFMRIAQVKKSYDMAIPTYMYEQEKLSKTSFLTMFRSWAAPLIIICGFSLFTRKQPNTYWLRKNSSPAASIYTWHRYFLTVLLRKIKVWRLASRYRRFLSVNVPNKFVFVALHYQPEETSCPSGGLYADQINILKVLNEMLPDDIAIVVKEHKTQFYTHTESASGRGLGYYAELKSVAPERITFVSVDSNPFELIDKAYATVTIGGTIGWESAIRGTPVLIFGRAWYEAMPNVHKVKSKKDLTAALIRIDSDSGNDRSEDIYNFHRSLEKRLIKAKHYKAFLNNSDIELNESRQNLVDGLSGYLQI